MPIFTRPLTEEQLKKLKEREKPSQEEILAAQDRLFLFLLERVNTLEAELGLRK